MQVMIRALLNGLEDSLQALPAAIPLPIPFRGYPSCQVFWSLLSPLLSSGSQLGFVFFPSFCALTCKAHQATEEVIAELSSLGFHHPGMCPSWSHMQHLQNHDFIYFIQLHCCFIWRINITLWCNFCVELEYLSKYLSGSIQLFFTCLFCDVCSDLWLQTLRARFLQRTLYLLLPYPFLSPLLSV